MGIGDWGLGPIPNPHPFNNIINYNNFKNIKNILQLIINFKLNKIKINLLV